MGEEVVRSLSNPLVKRLVRLRQRREREREGVLVVEGALELERALAAGYAAELLVTCPALHSDAARELEGRLGAYSQDRRLFAAAAYRKISLRERPDGLLALLRAPEWSLEELPWPEDGLYLVIAGLEKPGNVGALLRSADAVGAQAVFATGGGTDLGNPNVIRASMGSLFTRPVLAVESERLRQVFREQGVRVVATSPQAELDYWSASLLGRLAVVVGAEHQGLDEAWLSEADEVLAIPMRGAADSLNVATAGALVLFEALRQRTDAARRR